MPKVSIVVPCYKVEKYLDRCVNSLINQTLQDIEIILVDDGSPDNTPQMCDNWAKMDTRIQVIHKKNDGLGMACNSGIELASGSYIAFCDSDDYVDLNCYYNLYEYAIKNNSDAVYSGIKRVNQLGVVTPMAQPLGNRVYEEHELTEFQLDMIAAPIESPIERARQMSAKTVLYSSKVIKDNHVRFKSEREFISEDLLFNLDFLRYCKCVSEISESYYYYYVNTQSLSQTLRKDRMQKYLLLREYILSTYSLGQDPRLFKERVNKMFIGYIRSAIRQIVDSAESYEEKLRLLSSVCDDKIWTTLSHEFPVNKLPIGKRLVFYLTKYKLVYLLYAMFSIKR